MTSLLRDHRARTLPSSVLTAIAVMLLMSQPARGLDGSFSGVIDHVQPRIVKIFGAGGVRGLEAYQSGFLISAEGHLLTSWSYVLDTDRIGVTLDDGRQFVATLVGIDPVVEVAVLKIDGADLPHFDLATSVDALPGTRVLAFSNAFGVATGDERATVQHGVVSTIVELDARRGTFKVAYKGKVYLLDAMTNNPGAAGGALTNAHGELIGLLGKELRSAQDNTWVSYAIPMVDLAESVKRILSGERIAKAETKTARATDPLNLEALGIVLVPEIAERTPPFVDLVRPGSPAVKAGLRADDLILFVDGQLVQSCAELRESLARIERGSAVELSVQREDKIEKLLINSADRADASDLPEPNLP